VYDIGEMPRLASRFISHVRREVQNAYEQERSERRITQQEIAKRIGVHRSVINRQLGGIENMTLRSVAELLGAMGWEPVFEARKIRTAAQSNQPVPDPSPPKLTITPSSTDDDVDLPTPSQPPIRISAAA
jgi:hypothetical protein